MVKWEYLEAHIMKSPGIYPMKLIVPQVYIEAFKLTDVFFTLKELGDLGWNMVCVIDNLDEDETRIIFKRPNA